MSDRTGNKEPLPTQAPRITLIANSVLAQSTKTPQSSLPEGFLPDSHSILYNGNVYICAPLQIRYDPSNDLIPGKYDNGLDIVRANNTKHPGEVPEGPLVAWSWEKQKYVEIDIHDETWRKMHIGDDACARYLNLIP